MINVGIIGCGSVHQVHTEAIAANKNLHLEMAADVIAERVSSTAKQYGCRQTTDYRDIINDPEIDAIHICTPHHLHHPMAIEAMKAGKHVLVEKPMAIKVADAAEMIRVSEQTSRQIGICFQNRYNRTNTWVKHFLASGEAGQIIGARAFLTWFRDAEYYNSAAWRGTWHGEGGGLLINQAIHSIDLMNWFMGRATKLKASIDTRILGEVIEVEDTAEATIFYENNVPLILFASNCYVASPKPIIEIICEKASIRIENEVRVTHKDGRVELIYDDDLKIGPKDYWGSSHPVLINDFYESLATGKPFAIGGQQGLNALKIVEGIYRSAKIGKYIVLD